MKTKNPAAVALGSIKSDKKTASSRENGKKGGRPRNPKFTQDTIDMMKPGPGKAFFQKAFNAQK